MKKKDAIKPDKPDGFPMHASGNGQWCKKIHGRKWYFGPWNDPDAALTRFNREFAQIVAGKDPRRLGATGADSGRFTFFEVAEAFLDVKDRAVRSGELHPKTFAEYQITAVKIAKVFGKSAIVEDLTPQDFQRLRDSYPEHWALKSVAKEIRHARMLFKFAADEQMIAAPLNFGQAFKEPRREALRKKSIQKKREHGLLMFTAPEVRQMIAASDPTWQALILLGVNCGFGNTDLSDLPIDVIDLQSGWIDYERAKTSTDRRCKLWPETIAAVDWVLQHRRQARSEADQGILFLTKYGNRYVRQNDKGTFLNAISGHFGKFLRDEGLKRLGLNFYSLRRTFATIGAETGLQIAVNYVMGHVDASIPGVYRQRVSDDQITTVTDHVRQWVFDNSVSSGDPVGDPVGSNASRR